MIQYRRDFLWSKIWMSPITLRYAIKKRKPTADLILHTERGIE